MKQQVEDAKKTKLEADAAVKAEVRLATSVHHERAGTTLLHVVKRSSRPRLEQVPAC